MSYDPLRSSSPTSSSTQQLHLSQQDTHLNTLEASLERQHALSLQMNQELDLHQELLQDLDRGSDHTGLRLGGASDKLETLRRTVKDHGKSIPIPVRDEGRLMNGKGSVYAIVAVIVVLVILIALFK